MPGVLPPPRKQYSRAGNAREDIRKEEAEAASVEKAGYPETVWAQGTGKGCVYPVIPKITASVHFRQGKDITVTCQRRIILVQDILSGNF